VAGTNGALRLRLGPQAQGLRGPLHHRPGPTRPYYLKRKGYGVRSTIGPDGVERFRLVVPDGQAIPAHVARGSSKAEG